MKVDRLHAHLKAAEAYAELSKAKRLKVGAVIVKEDRIISLGYNGMPSGGFNECEVIKDGVLQTRPEVIHGEINSIFFAAKNGISTDGASMVTTHSPCMECSKAIIQSGIKHVYFKEKYRDESGVDFLLRYGVIVSEI